MIETPTFQRLAAKLWSDDERLAFIDWIATNPTAGVVLLVTLYAKKVKTNITANEIHEVLNHE